MKNNCKKTIKYNLFIFLTVFAVAFSTVISLFAGIGNVVFSNAIAETDEPVTVSIEARTADDNGKALVNAQNKIVYYVFADKPPVSPVTVSIRSRNRSAVADEGDDNGDFIAVDTFVVLTPSNYRTQLSVQTFNRQPIAIVRDGSEVVPEFEIEIYSVDGNAVISDTKRSLLCETAHAVYTANVNYYGSYETFSDYVNPVIDYKYTSGIRLWAESSWRDVNFNFSDYDLFNTLKPKFFDTGIADYYVSAEFNCDSPWDCWSPLYFDMLDKKDHKYFSEGYYRCDDEHIVIGYDNDDAYTCNGFSDRNSRLEIEGRGGAFDGYYFKFADPSLKILFHNDCDEHGFSFYNQQYFVLAVDNKAPVIQRWYMEKNLIRKGDTLRLSARFNEPVQLSYDNISVQVGGSIFGDSIDFKYKGGAGTNTLWFEFDTNDYDGEIDIDKFYIKGFTSYSNVIDYAYNATCQRNSMTVSGYNNAINASNVTCNLDTRTPAITTKQISKVATAKSHTVDVTVSKIDNLGTLQYAFSKSSEFDANALFTTAGNCKSFRVTESDISGLYYLHLKATSYFGKEKTNVSGPYRFDCIPPSVTNISVARERQAYSDHDISFEILDYPLSAPSAISKITLLYSESLDWNEQTVKTGVVLYDKEQPKNRLIIDADGKCQVNLQASDFGIDGVNLQYGKYYVGFLAEDALGNVKTISDSSYLRDYPVKFDVRDLCTVTMSNVSTPVCDGENPVFDISQGAEIEFNLISSEFVAGDYFNVKEIRRNGEVVKTGSDSDTNFTITKNGDKEILIKVNNLSGFLEFSFEASESSKIKSSDNFGLFFTFGSQTAETANFNALNNGAVFINKVYQLDDEYCYFMNAMGNVVASRYTNKQVFSSVEEAEKFVDFQEKQDLFLYKITDSAIAEQFNSETVTQYRKATDETTVAEVNQYWIRYKKRFWTKSTNSSDWVFYFYGYEKPSINLADLPLSLQTALTEVTGRIVANGNFIYLTEANFSLNNLGAPSLSVDRYHFEPVETDITKSGCAFSSKLRFYGDKNIFSTNVLINGTLYPLATNFEFTFGDRTKLFYKQYGSGDFVEIPKKSGSVLSDYINSTGNYVIREIDEAGLREYTVYVDCTAPTVKVYYSQIDGSSPGSFSLTENSNGKTINAKNFSLGAIENEVDLFSYVAVFNYAGTELKDVFSYDYLAENVVDFSSGRYKLAVYDRSGNHYYVYVRINSQEIDCNIVEKKNLYFKFSSNRSATEIFRYEVFCDGILVDSVYSADGKTYTDCGLYQFYVEDIYGGTFEFSKELIREFPSVTWQYFNNGKFSSYTGNENCITISATDNSSYTIHTNCDLRLVFADDAKYKFEFLSDVSHSVYSSGTETRVTINDANGWTVKIYYENDPNTYCLYSCSTDVTPPTINVSVQENSFIYEDEQERIDILKKLTDNELSMNIGDIFDNSENILFYRNENNALNKLLSNGASSFGNIFFVNLKDESEIKIVRVFLDDVLIHEEINELGVSDFTLSRTGHYKIEAEDILGNKSSFSFANVRPDEISYSIDGNEVDFPDFVENYIEKNPDGSLSFNLTHYGKESAVFGAKVGATFSFVIRKDGQVTEKAVISIEQDGIYAISYVLGVDKLNNDSELNNENEQGWTAKKVKGAQRLFYANELGRFAGAWYPLNADGIDLSASFDANGNIFIKVDAFDDGTSKKDISVRVVFEDNNDTYFFNAELFNGISSLSAKMTDADNETSFDDGNKTYFLNKPFELLSKVELGSHLKEIKVAFSSIGSFSNTDYADVTNGQIFEIDGFYGFYVLDKYGNVSKFTVNLSQNLTVVTRTEYSDGGGNFYTTEYGKDIYSDKKVEIDVYGNSDDFTFEVRKNNEPVSLHNVGTAAYVTLLIDSEGTYDVKITDKFLNVFESRVIIKSVDFAFDRNLLSGFNEKALRFDEMFTNTAVSVNRSAVDSQGIKFLSVTFGTVETVLLDLLNEDTVDVLDELLTNIVGASGNGAYTVLVRNQYGTAASAVIRYNNEPTLLLSRTLRSKRDAENFDLSEAIASGFYSNSILTLDTSAIVYKLTVDGKQTTCPCVLEYPVTSDTGSFEFNIAYVDEYGNNYAIKAYLVRQEISFAENEINAFTIVGDNLITKLPVSLSFEEKQECYYTLDGGEPQRYFSQQQLLLDGQYRFVLTDMSGNNAVLSVKKDTVAQFEFVVTESAKSVIDGGVVNGGTVAFRNKLDTKIKKVFLNGIELVNNNELKFRDNGKWEFLIADEVGNERYFSFFILAHSVNAFTYTTPYKYVVSSLMIKTDDDIEENLTETVEQLTDGSSFTLDRNGFYTVTLLSLEMKGEVAFSVTIDKTPPAVTLLGCDNGDETLETVSVSGFKKGDQITIIKNNAVFKNIIVTSESMEAPTFDDKGDYKIIVKNEAGNTTELYFTRLYTTNTAGSILIIVALLLIVIGLFVGLVYRTKIKSDK